MDVIARIPDLRPLPVDAPPSMASPEEAPAAAAPPAGPHPPRSRVGLGLPSRARSRAWSASARSAGGRSMWS